MNCSLQIKGLETEEGRYGVGYLVRCTYLVYGIGDRPHAEKNCRGLLVPGSRICFFEKFPELLETTVCWCFSPTAASVKISHSQL